MKVIEVEYLLESKNGLRLHLTICLEISDRAFNSICVDKDKRGAFQDLTELVRIYCRLTDRDKFVKILNVKELEGAEENEECQGGEDTL